MWRLSCLPVTAQHGEDVLVLRHVGQVLQLQRVEDVRAHVDPPQGVAGGVTPHATGVLGEFLVEVVQPAVQLLHPLVAEGGVPGTTSGWGS